MVKQLHNPTRGAVLRRIVARMAGAGYGKHTRKNILRKLGRGETK